MKLIGFYVIPDFTFNRLRAQQKRDQNKAIIREIFDMPSNST